MKHKLLISLSIFIIFVVISCDSGIKFNNPNDPNNRISQSVMGELGGECYPNQTCDDALVCDEESNICIKDPENTNSDDDKTDTASENDDDKTDTVSTNDEDKTDTLPETDDHDSDSADTAPDKDSDNTDSEPDNDNSDTEPVEAIETCSGIIECQRQCDNTNCNVDCYKRGTSEAQNDFYERNQKCPTYTELDDLKHCLELNVKCGIKGDETYETPYGHAVINGSFPNIHEAGTTSFSQGTFISTFVTGNFGSNGNIPDPTVADNDSFAVAFLNTGNELILLQTYNSNAVTGKTPDVIFVINAHSPGTYLVGLGNNIQMIVRENPDIFDCYHAFGYGYLELSGTGLAEPYPTGAYTINIKGEVDLYSYKNAPMYVGTSNTGDITSENLVACEYKHCDNYSSWNGSQCVGPCDTNPCSSVENSTGTCNATSAETYSCECKSGYLWTNSQCKKQETEEQCASNSDCSGSTPYCSISTSQCIANAVFITEYVEGSGGNKAIEIYNGSKSSVNLGNFTIQLANNGMDWGENSNFIYSFTASTAIPSGATFVFCNAAPDNELVAKCDQTPTSAVFQFNGNDGIALFDGTSIVDQIGNAMEQISWSVAGVSSATTDHTLRRKTSVIQGTTDWAASAGTTAENSQWIVLDKDTFDGLGTR